MRILVIKLGALGDVINTLPAVIRLKNHFQAEIHWLVAPLSLPLIQNHPAVDHHILFDRNKKGSIPGTIKAMRAIHYDMTIDFQRTLKSGLFCMAAKSRLKLGFDKKRCKEYTWLFPFTRIPPDDPNKHMLNQYLDFCRFLEIPDEERVHWEIPNSPDTTADLPTPYVVLNIGATKKANRWSPEKFAALADMLWNKKRIFCVLTGGQGDANQSMIITEKAMSRVINLVGKTSIQDLTGILDHAMAVVSCDTGPMHLSVALGTPTIALFGPSNPRRTGPYKGEVILAHYHCSPCNHKKCPDPRCMAMIDPEEVYKKTVVHTSASPSPVHPVN